MRRALDLAVRGKGFVSPNPCVGCVIVKNGKIVGEGYHREFGGPHAEVNALRHAGSAAKGSTVYLTLEPCTHWGKTPPCAPELIRANVKRVVIAMEDPNPIVSSRGVSALRKAGIDVIIGVEEEAARNLIRSFITWMTKKRPHVILKMAMTLDGKIATATGDSKWISSKASRALGHKLRAESDAILVGSTTARRDKPALTSHGAGRDPKRFVVSSGGRKQMKAREILSELARQNMAQVLVEGGGETAWPFIKENLVDELYFFIAPKIIGGRTAPSPVGGEGFRRVEQGLKLGAYSVMRIGDDVLIHALNKAA